MSKANQYARDHGLRQFVVYQGQWSAASRDFEREIIPMCKAEGMGIAPWGVLGGGHLRSTNDTHRARKMGDASNAQIAVAKTLDAIAKEKEVASPSVAIAYLLRKTPYVFPIVGGRKIEHLRNNIQSLQIVLEKEDVKRIDDAAPFDLGFPHSFLSHEKDGTKIGPGTIWFEQRYANVDHVPQPEPISLSHTGQGR